MQDITFNSHGAKIAGQLYMPDSTNEQVPVIVLCHGFCGVKELLIPAFADRFAAKGFAALTFDYRGFGESEGEAGRLVPALQIEDILAAIDYVSDHEQLDAKRIALWGTSFGGANAIYAASKSEHVRCLCVQLSFADGERVITGNMTTEEKEKLLQMLTKMRGRKESSGKEMMVPISKVLSDEQSITFYQQHYKDFPALDIKIPFLTVAETISHKPEQALGNLSMPIQIIAAENDGVNPSGESKILFDGANDPKELHVIEGAQHYDVYYGESFERAVDLQLSWYRKYL